MGKRGQSVKYKKAPQAPRRFKSAYMFFSTEKHKKIREQQGEKIQTTTVAKMVSQAWKSLSEEERQKWNDMASRDKARYEVEKTMYTGPWKVPAKKRTQKDPNAPKRPMSAFLSFSNSKRAQVKGENKDIGNAEVSRILAKMWKEAPEEERKEHIDEEYRLRQDYKTAIAEWRKVSEDELQSVRKQREDIALRALDEGDGQVEAAVEVAGQHQQQENRQLEESNAGHQGYPQAAPPGMPPPNFRGRPVYPPYPGANMYPPAGVPSNHMTGPGYPQHYDGYNPSIAHHSSHGPPSYDDQQHHQPQQQASSPEGGPPPPYGMAGHPPPHHRPPPEAYYGTGAPVYQDGYGMPYPQQHPVAQPAYGGPPPPPGYENGAYDQGYYGSYYPPPHHTAEAGAWSSSPYQAPYAGNHSTSAATPAGGEPPHAPHHGHGGYGGAY